MQLAGSGHGVTKQSLDIRDTGLANYCIRSQHILGTARVRVRHLKLDTMKYVNEERVKRLACDFNRGGCRHHDAAHAVPALINPADLNAALAHANLSISALFGEDDRPML